MKRRLFFLAVTGLLLLSACQSHRNPCEQEDGPPIFLTVPPDKLPTPAQGSSTAPIEIKIGGRNILVDRVIEGPLCNDTWSGTVYVTCNVQVYPWVENPTFLKNCKLDIAPDTVVYVAYHNDTAYYKGCSCHTGETEIP